MQGEAELFDVFLRDADVPAFLTSPDGRILRANAAFARTLGRDADWRPFGAAEDLLSADFTGILRHAWYEAIAAPGAGAVFTGEAFQHLALAFRHQAAFAQHLVQQGNGGAAGVGGGMCGRGALGHGRSPDTCEYCP